MKKDSKRNMLACFVGGGIAVLSVMLLAGVLMYTCIGKPNTVGEFGDMFGAVNTLFSGLAFLGVIITVWMQSEELRLQRKELESTRAELERSASAQEKTLEIMKRDMQLRITQVAPMFELVWMGTMPVKNSKTRIASFELKNVGQRAKQVVVTISGEHVEEKVSEPKTIPAGYDEQFSAYYAPKTPLNERHILRVDVTCSDDAGVPHNFGFEHPMEIRTM